MARLCQGCLDNPEPPGSGWRICAGCVAMLARLEAIHGKDNGPDSAKQAAAVRAAREGRCCRCRLPAVPGGTMCEHHRAALLAYRAKVAAAGRAKPPEVCGYKGCRHPATHGRYCRRHHDRRNLEARAAGRFHAGGLTG